VEDPHAVQDVAGEPQALLESVGRLISEAQAELRGGAVDPGLLKALGMNQDQFRTFIDQYSQRLQQVGWKPQRVRPGDEDLTVLGTGQLLTGRGADPAMGTVRGSERLTPDQERKLHEARAAEVSAEFRQHVEAYFRAISESSTPTTLPTR